MAVSLMTLDPGSADVVYAFGVCLYYSGNLEDGINQFQRALELNPDHSKSERMLMKAESFKIKIENGDFNHNQYLFSDVLHFTQQIFILIFLISSLYKCS